VNKHKRAVLFVNGEKTPGFSVKTSPSDWLVAVDGGLRHIVARKRLPDLLIGDLDSVDPRELAACEAAKVEIVRFPAVKEKTDLELALDIAIERGFNNIVIAYAQGSRADHSLANLSVLARPDLKGVDIKLEDGRTAVVLIKGPDQRAITTKPDDLVSLIPWGAPAQGVTTRNLLYPLLDETLLPWQSRGVSNIATAKQAIISLTDGALLVIHTRLSVGSKGKA
jgi:thiamine pyrophosphokinase